MIVFISNAKKGLAEDKSWDKETVPNHPIFSSSKRRVIASPMLLYTGLF